MLVGFEIPRISRTNVRALKVPYEDVIEVCPRVDAVSREVLEPHLGAFCEAERQVLDDEEAVIHSACSMGEAEIF